MSDFDALIRTIRQDPWDDAPRLALADVLDENGDPEWAEFIRLQIEMAQADGEARHKLSNRAYAVWSKGRYLDWFTRGAKPGFEGINTFCAGVYEESVLVCDYPVHGFPERGLIGSIKMPVASLEKLGPRIGQMCPGLTRVVLTGCEPYAGPDNDWHWYDVTERHSRAIHPASDIPAQVYEKLPGRDDPISHFKVWRSRAAAEAALAKAAADYCRSLALEEDLCPTAKR